MLKVNSGDSLFNSFIRSYNAYQQYKFLHITGDTSTLDRIIVNSTDADAIPVFDFRDRYNIAVSPHQTIIINAGMEGSFIFQLDEVAKATRLPLPKNKKCIFFSDSKFEKIDASTVNCLPLTWPWFLLEQLTALTSTQHIASFVDVNRDYTSPKQFNFCSLIGVKRDLRDLLVEKIISQVTRKDYVLQYHGKTLGLEPVGDIKYSLDNYDSYKQFDILHSNEYYSISKSLPIDLYNNSNFMLVVENILWDECDIHITEKATKALITGIPFVVAANSNFIKELHQLGFKTYNTLWDESYDSIGTANERFDAIIKLINELNHFNWAAHADELAAIAKHNRLNFFNLNKHMITAFEQFDKYIYDVL